VNRSREITGFQRENSVSKVFRRLKESGVIEPIDPTTTPFFMAYKLKEGWEDRFTRIDEINS
jgi:hypothetical protein